MTEQAAANRGRAGRHPYGEEVACTDCGSTNTEMIGLFGAFNLASQFYCLDCGNPFGRIRWDEDAISGPPSGKDRKQDR